MRAAFFSLLLLLVPATALAAESLSMGSAVLQMLWALLIVIGLILIIAAIARRRFGRGTLRPGAINVVELRHIMPKTTLALIEIRGRELLIGIGGNRIELLADLSGQPGQPDADFDDILTRKH